MLGIWVSFQELAIVSKYSGTSGNFRYSFPKTSTKELEPRFDCNVRNIFYSHLSMFQFLHWFVDINSFIDSINISKIIDVQKIFMSNMSVAVICTYWIGMSEVWIPNDPWFSMNHNDEKNICG